MTSRSELPSTDEELSQAISDGMALAERIHPLLAGKGSSVQACALADLLATWLAGHYLLGPAVLDELLADHIAAVRSLVPCHIEIITQRRPH